MSENTQKYENWRAITESDYVTMFIKTWFAFVATLRELYPKENVDDIIGRGDKVFLNPYLDNFANQYYPYNTISKVKEDMLRVYKLGRSFTLGNKKYNRFFAEDFYAVNKKYFWKKSTEDYECSLTYSSDYTVSVYAKYLDKSFYLNGTPLIVSEKISILDLITSSNLSQSQVKMFLDDEAAYINYVAEAITKRISVGFVSQVTAEDFTSQFPAKAILRLNALSLSIYTDMIAALGLMKDPSIQGNSLLFSQVPCANFIYKAEDGADIPEIDTYKWFLNFVYFMRNALFHEIIDPLDTFWQEIFKHSYLALKEILDGNINYFLEKEGIQELLNELVWTEMFEKPDVYIPNFAEDNKNGKLIVSVTEYTVGETIIYAKAELTFDYRDNMHSMKRLTAQCRAEFLRENKTEVKFKMKKLNIEDLL